MINLQNLNLREQNQNQEQQQQFNQQNSQNFRHYKGVQQDKDFYSFKDIDPNNNNNGNNRNNSGQQNNSRFNPTLENFQKVFETGYIERMKSNPYIKNIFLNNSFQDQIGGQENQDLFIRFNTSPFSNYKLKYYTYGTSSIKRPFNLRYYPKYYMKNYVYHRLNFYNLFNRNINDQALSGKNRDNMQYGPFLANWDVLQEKELINTQEYKGFYSYQYDYQIFKMMQQQEVPAEN
ncbi:hypothetical protein PPERSA_01564 [Pseudocohnilembus persalinus]|uniref:Uncharacterized protein n=1 Tax=Pseudocohnilembus persalinus TaxID=266149 RepID=A0A0V0QHN6_PSEPJ|nr:hypothetical protein PPERSA_01564 [Pseudocohnilembus persalinus]|eukprot:KRX01694.1 hypothetical protein PPERSA_01564 [Pseudocohnilembus persalinus]